MSAAAEAAVTAVMGRIIRDPRIAYLMGPGSETYDLVTAAVAESRGETPEAYRARIEPQLRTEAVVGRDQYDTLERRLDEALARAGAL